MPSFPGTASSVVAMSDGLSTQRLQDNVARVSSVLAAIIGSDGVEVVPMKNMMEHSILLMDGVTTVPLRSILALGLSPGKLSRRSRVC